MVAPPLCRAVVGSGPAAAVLARRRVMGLPRRFMRTSGRIRWPSPEAVEDKEPLPSLLHAALIEDVEGRPRPALELAKKAQVDHLSTLTPSQQLLLQNLIGVAELKLGLVHTARRTLDVAREMAKAVGDMGRADDAYRDVAGVLSDLAVAKMMMGEVESARNDLNRALFMAQRAYRPDNDLLATLHSNHGELACLEQKWDAADEHHTKAAHLSDFIEHSAMSLSQQSPAPPAAADKGTGGAGGGSCQVGARTETAEEQYEPTRIPPGLLAVSVRNVVRRLNVARLRARTRLEKEAVVHLHQALQDCRVLCRHAMQGQVLLYAQCLAAVATCHLATRVRTGDDASVAHLRLGPEHELTWNPQGLLDKALSVMAAVLGPNHPDTWACTGNLALLQPLDIGEASLRQLRAAVLESATAATTTPSIMQDPPIMGLGPLDVWAQAIRPIDHNIDLLLRRRPTNDPCLADIPPPYIYTVPRVIWQYRLAQHIMAISLHRPPRLLPEVQGVLGVGLRLPASAMQAARDGSGASGS